jgi:hypothetical protein
LPLPRNPVTIETGSFSVSAKRGDERGVERIERSAGETFRLEPERPDVRDDRSPSGAVAEHVVAAAPVVETEPEVLEHPVQQAQPQELRPPPTALLGPVLADEDAAERAHMVEVTKA